LTKKGWQVSGDTLVPPKRINRVPYFHDTTRVNLAQQLIAKTNGDFVPERRLQAERRAEKGASTDGSRAICLMGQTQLSMTNLGQQRYLNKAWAT